MAELARAAQRHVKTGQRNRVVAKIRNGVEAGGKVMAHPGGRVTDGVRTTARH